MGGAGGRGDHAPLLIRLWRKADRLREMAVACVLRNKATIRREEIARLKDLPEILIELFVQSAQ